MTRWLLGITVAIGLTACEGPDATPTGIEGASATDELVSEREQQRIERERDEAAVVREPRGARTDIAPVEDALGLPGGRYEERLQGPPTD